jgi:hypothetical protein
LLVDTGYSINDGNGGGNYTVTSVTASGTIDKAALTLIASGDTKTYDATTNSNGAVTVSGLKGSDTVTGATQSFDSRNAGNRTVLVDTGYSLNDGNGGGNYTVTSVTAAGTIDKAALTLIAAGDTKTYDATANSNGTVTVSGLKGPDTVTGTSQAFASPNAGVQAVNVTGYTVNDSNSGGNYTVATQTASGTINKAVLTLTASGDPKTYDATTASTGIVGVTGLKGSDTVTGATQSFDSQNAGSRTMLVDTGYSINDGNGGENYTVTSVTASGTIDKAALTLIASSGTKTYDATTASTGIVGITGLKGSDTVTGATQSFDSQNAGSRTMLVDTGYSINDGNGGGNYTVTSVTAIGTIDKAPLTLIASSDTKTYDATTASTGIVGVTGLKGADTVTGASQAFASKNAGTQTLDVTGYMVNDGNSGGNYAVTSVTATGAIDKAVLTAGLTGTTSKTYDATLSAALSAGNYTLTGIKGSDGVALNLPTTGVYGDANAGAGKTVAVTGLALTGADAGNYTVNGTASANIGTITLRNLTITAASLGKTVGDADPLLVYALTSGSLAGNDSLSGALGRSTGENPGAYAIGQGTLAATPNYDVTFIPGVFTIATVARQNDPVVNPVSGSSSGAGQPMIQTAPIGLGSGGGGSGGGGPTASDASGTSASAGGAKDAGSSAGGDEKTSAPSLQTAGQSGGVCTGEGCSNTPYPANQAISSSIRFSQ